jgi:hypothetical protein
MTQRVWDELERLLEARRLSSRAVSALSDAAFGYRVRNSSYSLQAEVSEQVGNQDLKALVKAGLLIAEGETRGRVYIASPLVKDIYLKSYEPKTYVDPFAQMTLPLTEAVPEGAH